MNKNRVLLYARRATLLVPLLALAYLSWRFDLTRLPDSGCSPLLRFSPGSSLVVDKHPRDYQLRDAVFFLGPDGALYLGAIQEHSGAGYWIVTDNPLCAGQGSDQLGAIERGAFRGRVLFALGAR